MLDFYTLSYLVCSQIFKLFAFQPFDFERTILRLFQKRAMRSKFDIYIFIVNGKIYSRMQIVLQELLNLAGHLGSSP